MGFYSAPMAISAVLLVAITGGDQEPAAAELNPLPCYWIMEYIEPSEGVSEANDLFEGAIFGFYEDVTGSDFWPMEDNGDWGAHLYNNLTVLSWPCDLDLPTRAFDEAGVVIEETRIDRLSFYALRYAFAHRTSYQDVYPPLPDGY